MEKNNTQLHSSHALLVTLATCRDYNFYPHKLRWINFWSPLTFPHRDSHYNLHHLVSMLKLGSDENSGYVWHPWALTVKPSRSQDVHLQYPLSVIRLCFPSPLHQSLNCDMSPESLCIKNLHQETTEDELIACLHCSRTIPRRPDAGEGSLSNIMPIRKHFSVRLRNWMAAALAEFDAQSFISELPIKKYFSVRFRNCMPEL